MKPIETQIENDIKLVSKEHNLDKLTSEALTLNVFFQNVPAKFGDLEIDVTSVHSKEDLIDFIVNKLNFQQVIEKFSHIAVSTFSKVDDPNDEEIEDEDDFDAFGKHIKWLYGELDSLKADSYGKIQAALLQKPTVKCNVTDKFIEYTLTNLGGSVFLNKGHEFFKQNSEAIAKYFILTSKFDFRLFTSILSFNIQEKDYDGDLAGIADYMGDMSEEDVDWGEFIQMVTLKEDIRKLDYINVITDVVNYYDYKKSNNNKNNEKDDEDEDEDHDDDEDDEYDE